jgi:FMN phosphatase YigB (HAD superfamily)|tara:strand:- start:84 stop:596 length:513 start_codon:yes stop_codon:yes gene_type:complete
MTVIKKAFVFDFDDTLAKTDARVVVVMPNTKTCRGYTKELSASQFNEYQLKMGERFDFSEFRCPVLVENGNPTELIRLAQDVYQEEHSVYILTARGNDVADAISKFLFVHKIKAKQIICLGDNDEGSSIAESKRVVLHTIMQSYDKIYFYDDNEKNIELAKEVGVKSYLV